jgi:peptidase M15-like protein
MSGWAAAVVALVLAACGSSSAPPTSTGTGSTPSPGPVAVIPQAHPQAVEPAAGAHASAAPDGGTQIVGDISAHAPSLAVVKRELKRLNLCGGVTNSADAAPVIAASGAGFIADPGTSQTEGELPTLTAQLNALGKALGLTIYGISGYRTPAHSVAVGGFADDPHTRGEAEDVGVNSLLRSSAAQISEAQLAQFGLYRPFDPSDDPGNTEVNHIQLIPKAGPLTLTQVNDTFNPDPSCR